MARIVAGGAIENVYRLQIMNATEQALRFGVHVEGLPGLVVASAPEVEVAATESRWVSVRLQVPPELARQSHSGAQPIHVLIDAHGAQGESWGHLSEKTVFIIPDDHFEEHSHGHQDKH